MKKELTQVFLDTQHVLSEFERKSLNKEAFCLVPFTNIILEPNGEVGICRQKGTEFTVGDLKQNTLMEIWNGEKVRNWRKEFLEGDIKNCNSEIANNKCNLCPQNNKLLDYVEMKEVQSSLPIKLTANFNGFCNLQCQMCDVWKLPNGYYTEENFWRAAREELFPNLKEVDMLSGEPFLQNDTFKLINEISSINKKCEWTITTNAHYKLSEKITNHLDEITFKNLIISVDSLVPEVYAKIRNPGRLSQVMETVDRYLDYQKRRLSEGRSSLNIKMNFLIQRDNWIEMKSMLDYCREKGISPFITFCYRPEEFSLLSLSHNNRLEILRYLGNELNFKELSLCGRVTRPLITSLNPIDKAEILSVYLSKKEEQ